VTEDLLAGYPVVIEQAVAWGEMDAFQHVNNVAYFRYFENARLEYFKRLGWGVARPDGVGPIVASIQARFRKPLTYPDVISIGARISSLDTDRFTIEHVIVSRRLGAVATEGHCLIVTFNYDQGKKAPIPDDLRKHIEMLEGRAK
jgi:acyl-CoA thioester hydrolase